jgi:DNA-binding GntR family transcriptional regulator
MEFHELIFAQSGQSPLSRIWQSLRVPLRHVIRSQRHFFDLASRLYERHAKLYESLAGGEVQQTMSAVREHIGEFQPLLLERLSFAVAQPSAERAVILRSS